MTAQLDTEWLQRILVRLERMQAARSGRFHRLALAVALVLFAASIAFAVSDLPDLDGKIRVVPLVAFAIVGVPLTLVTNSEEYRISARILGHRVSFLDGVRVSIIASAANWLPIPGSLVVRTASLKGLGARTTRALSVNAITGIAWLGTTLLLCGTVIAVASSPWLWCAVFVGAAMLALVSLYVHRAQPGPQARYLTATLLAIELASVFVTAGRFALLSMALGVSANAEQMFALTASVVVASSVGFLPSGLGLREVLGGVFGGATGLDSAFGVLAVAIYAIVGQAVYAVLALMLLLTGNTPSRRPIEVDEQPLGEVTLEDMPDPIVHD